MKTSHSRPVIGAWSRRPRLLMRGLTLLLLAALVGVPMLQPILARADAPSQITTICYGHNQQSGSACLGIFTDSGQSEVQDAGSGDYFTCVLSAGVSGSCTVAISTTSVQGERFYTCFVDGTASGIVNPSCTLAVSPGIPTVTPSSASSPCYSLSYPQDQPESCPTLAPPDTHKSSWDYQGVTFTCVVTGQPATSCTVGVDVALALPTDVACLVNGQLSTSCTLEATQDSNYRCPAESSLGSPPADLLNWPTLNGTAAGGLCAGIENLEKQAIQNTLKDHGLPSSDAAAVQTWGRDDAEAELWGLLVQAFKLPACATGQIGDGVTCRTPDQQDAVDWMSNLVEPQTINEIYDAGLEYVKWAGLDQNTYSNDWDAYLAAATNGIDTSTSRAALESFLNQTPQNYAVPKPGVTWTSTTPYSTLATTATEGFCVYQPPAPNQNAYTPPGQMCYTPAGGYTCTIDCTPTSPTAQQFLQWGAAEADSDLTAQATSVISAAGGVTAGLALGGAAGAVGASLATYQVLVPILTPTFVEALKASTIAGIAASGGTTDIDAYLASGLWDMDVLEAVTDAASLASAWAGPVFGIIFFATNLTAKVLKMQNNAALAPQLAQSLESAPNTVPDLGSMVSDQNGVGDLYYLFLKATLPAPALNCNTGPVITGPHVGDVCLNPPPPPAVDQAHDPVFMVSENGQTATRQSSITYYDTSSALTATARLHENWFIEQVTDHSGTPLQVMYNNGVTGKDVQYLTIRYTDWDGNEQMAWLQPTADGYQFISLKVNQPDGTAIDPSTCLADKTCAVSDSIHYVDSSGNQYSASVAPAFTPVPAVSPSWSANPTEGQPVTLKANVTIPSDFTITSYKWEIQDKPLNAASTTVTESGDPLTYTFPTSGTFDVTLTVTASDAQVTTDSFKIQVADVAPTLDVYGPCYQLKSTFCIGTGLYNDFNLALANLGSPITLRGSVQNAGTEDFDQLTIRWGDGSSDEATNSGTNSDTNITFPGPPEGASEPAPTFSATHTYSRGGTYTVTVTVKDQGGAIVSQTINEEVVSTTTTKLELPDHLAVVGQQVTYTAKIDPSPDGGTVDFQDGGTDIAACAKQPITSKGAEGVATCVVTYSAAAPHSITARYSGDTLYAASSSVATTETVSKATTVTKTTSSQATTVWGELVTFTASISVAAPGAGAPTGTVEFKDGSVDICAAAVVDTSTETATCTTSALSVSTHTVTAVYSGDDNFRSSNTNAAALTQTVNKADSNTTLSASQEPATQGATVTFTAQVGPVAPGAGTPSGTVTFTDGSTTLGSAQLDGTGKASFSTSTLSLGAHTITVSYSGDGNFNSSASAALTQQIDTSLSAYPKTSSGAYNLSGANLTGAHLADMPLAGAKLSGANLTNANLTGSDLSGATVSGSNLKGANLSQTTLTNANLHGSNFMGANFSGADLSGANLSNSNFKSADFTGANLTKANLSGSNLASANFTNANLTGANLKGADISGVIWSKTTCPDGTNSSANGGTCKGHM